MPLWKKYESTWENILTKNGPLPYRQALEKGSGALFLDNAGEGMVSRITENIPNEHMSIRHLGRYKNGVEDYDSDEVKKCSNAFENYTLRNKNQFNELTVEIDTQTAHKSYFEEIWPTALVKVKALAETREGEI
ncbi:SRPBCC domain-containing protein [Pedobacter sp. ASV28]|uniref:SRPBCC domain-containing protein n=1 Tax=Pedobacter sp. ASV28 TaxID=2795123 RepID=UPI0018ED8346|nr:SRPBCC domain-containing protein [Pedobacter sp. ASV28]